MHTQRFEGEASVVRLPFPWSVKVELARFITLGSLTSVCQPMASLHVPMLQP